MVSLAQIMNTTKPIKTKKTAPTELLAYYWEDEPIYHPKCTKPMNPKAVKKTRMLSLTLLVFYIYFTYHLFQISGNQNSVAWVFGLILGAFAADFISGCAHIFIDFVPSIKKTPLHKELFLSRIHHHELFRPARLNLASLWLSPALYVFVFIGMLPFVCIKFFWESNATEWICPFWLVFLWLTAISQITHAVAHGKGAKSKLRKIFKIMQKFNIILSPKNHATHHRHIDRDFCVLNGWANPILNFVFKNFIENQIPEATSVKRQLQDMRKNLRYPYSEIL